MRKRSVLGNEDWRIIPWSRCEKDSLQQLFDIGFDLAEVLERMDLSSHLNSSNIEQTAHAELWSGCSRIFGQLEQWYSRHWQHRIHRQHICLPSDEASTSQWSPAFENFWEATNLVYYWSFKLILDEDVL